MPSSSSITPSIFLLLSFFLLLHHCPLPSTSTSSSLVGINYGLVADNLPPPSSVPALLHSVGVGRVRLYDADPNVLRSFAGTGIEFVIGLPDRSIPRCVSDPSFALDWVKSNVESYLPATKIVAVTVGNEVLTNADPSLAPSLLPAMEALHSALSSLGLDRHVQVTTSHSVAVLSSSYPPSAGEFRPDLLLPYLRPLLSFHARTGSPFLINAYPFFAYKSDPQNVSLEYALFEPNDGVTDPITGLGYDNMLFAQIDAVYAAIKKAAAGGPANSNSNSTSKDVGATVEVRVSETGWPSGGDQDEVGATVENAAKYNSNLMRLVMANKGTPLMPENPIRVYVFALFNENLKPGPTSERNYGLFKPDGTPAYKLDIDVSSGDNSTTTPPASGGAGGGGLSNSNSSSSSSGNNYSPDYYDFSAGSRWDSQWRVETMIGMGLLFFICQ